MGSVEYRPVPGSKTQILNGPGVLSLVDAKAEAIRSKAAGMYGAYGYGKKPARTGRGSAHSVVFTMSRYAKWENAHKNTLSKAMRSIK